MLLFMSLRPRPMYFRTYRCIVSPRSMLLFISLRPRPMKAFHLLHLASSVVKGRILAPNSSTLQRRRHSKLLPAMTDFSFLTGFFKKRRTGWTPRQRSPPVAEMGSRATIPSTVNLRIPAEFKSLPAEEGRGPVVAPQGLQPKRAAYQEKGITIKDMDRNRPFQAGDPSHSPSNPSANGKEKQKQSLGKTSRAGQHIQSLPEQSLNTGKNAIRGECSKPADSPFDILLAGSGELPNDHPMKQEDGSLLHSSYLAVLASESILIKHLIDFLEFHTPTEKFPDKWCDELENELMGNRHFLKINGLFTICKDQNQPVSGGQDKNLAERSHAAMSTESEVQERTPLLPFAVRSLVPPSPLVVQTPVPPSPVAVRTPRQPKPSDEDIDWTPSMEMQERAAPLRRRRRGPFKRSRASEPEERRSSALLAAKECAQRDGIYRCTRNAVQGGLYCAPHMRRNLQQEQ